MIYTVTLNPALDRTLWVEKIKPDDSNRIEKEEKYAGGKGTDISRVLAEFGVSNKALGFAGGFAGEELEGILLNEGISCDFIRISGETRTNIIVNEREGDQIVFNAKGPEIKPYELMQMIHRIEELEKPEIVAVSGSLPCGIHPVIYQKIIEIAKSRGAMVILDTDGDALKTGIRAHPDVIKPNIHELSRLVDRELKEMDEIISAAWSLHKKGVGIVLVSMGSRGILLVTEGKQYWASPPEVEVKNTIGAGDSAIAGFIYGLVSGKGLKDALIYAVAAGTATTLRPGTALCRKEDFIRLIPRVKLRVMKEVNNDRKE